MALSRNSRYQVQGVAPIGTQDFFGPGQPIYPMGPPGLGGRVLDYSIGENIRIQPRMDERLTYWELYELAENHDVTRLLIETRKDQMESLEYNIKPRGSSGKEGKNREQQFRINKTEDFFKYPDGEHSYATWQRELIDQVLVIDASSIYLNKETPGSTFLEILDGATIKRVIDMNGRTPLPNEGPAYQQIIKGLPAWDYTTEELIYSPRNPRVHKLYGCSPVQQIYITVNIALRRQASILQYFSEGTIPDALIGVPDTWSMSQIRDYQESWDAMHSGNTGQRRHARFIPGGTKYYPTKEVILKNDFDEWLARIACFAFSVPPTAFSKATNRASAQTAQEAALNEGLAPLMRWFKELMNFIIQSDHILGQHDLEFAWQEREDIDPAVRAKVIDSKIRNGSYTINEARAIYGDEPLEGGDVPMIYMGQGPIPVKIAAAQTLMDTETGSPSNNRSGKPGAEGGSPTPGKPSVPGKKPVQAKSPPKLIPTQQGKAEVGEGNHSPFLY